ncbi:cephalosporin hydroxylase family protein [Aliiglaciecola sp.]|nr:cephalosporin hydroxylase family protein [Aliiglaciecola sp.]
MSTKQVDKTKEFQQEVNNNVAKIAGDHGIQKGSMQWFKETAKYNYSYNFSWMNRPIIQVPQDIVAMQELIYAIRPDLIIETGIAHGGSLIFSASMLALLDMQDAIERGEMIDPSVSKRKVLGIDIDIRKHNRIEIEKHAMKSRIEMFEGSSISPEMINKVKQYAKNYTTILLCLDSNHTHEHVLAELNAYAPLVSIDSYCVVFDTIVEDMPDDMYPDRPWGKKDNPKTAVREYLKEHKEFKIDHSLTHKLLITVAPDGYLKKVK